MCPYSPSNLDLSDTFFTVSESDFLYKVGIAYRLKQSYSSFCHFTMTILYKIILFLISHTGDIENKFGVVVKNQARNWEIANFSPAVDTKTAG